MTRSAIAKRVQSVCDDVTDAQEGDSKTIALFDPRNISVQETDSSSSTVQLPPEVLAIILSKLPFPEIFQVKVLSQSWYHKLPSLNPVKLFTTPATQENAKSFILPRPADDDIIMGWSNWCTLCPVFLSGKEIVGYDKVHYRWRKIPVHHKLHEALHENSFKFMGRVGWIKFAGPLIFVYKIGASSDHGAGSKALVANALLGTWKVLSGFPAIHQTSTELSFGPKEDYNVVVHNLRQTVQSLGYVKIGTSVYESKTETWRRKESILKSQAYDEMVGYGTDEMYCAFLDGNVYCMLGTAWSRKLELWLYNMETEAWAQVQVDLSFGDIDYTICGLFSVASRIVVVVMVDSCDEVLSVKFSEAALVYVLDMSTLQISQPSSSPRMQIGRPAILRKTKVVSDSECLYFVRSIRHPGQASFPSDIWSFHVSSRTWVGISGPPVDYLRSCGYSCLARGAFAPGLNPFSAP